MSDKPTSITSLAIPLMSTQRLPETGNRREKGYDYMLLYTFLFHLLGAVSSVLLAFQSDNAYSLLLIGLVIFHTGQLTHVSASEKKSLLKLHKIKKKDYNEKIRHKHFK